jgi:hypothetical protein
MHRLALLAAVLAACTSPNREHADPEDLCTSDPPPVQEIFRIDADGDPKGWAGWVDGVRVRWVRYENGEPMDVANGSISAHCYPGGIVAEACTGRPTDDTCDCYLPSGETTDCETAFEVLAEFYRADALSDGADSAR